MCNRKRAEQIVGRERRERVSHHDWSGDASLNSRRRVNSTVMCFSLPTINRAIIWALLLLALPVFAHSQQPTCKSPIEYGNRNQIDPKRSNVRRLSGRVIAEAGRPAKEVGAVPACLGLFTENDHRLVASAVADEEGRFKFKSVVPGRYRLVVRDPQNAFCLANMPLRVVGWPRGTTKPLVIHMRPSGIDDCSYGDFK